MTFSSGKICLIPELSQSITRVRRGPEAFPAIRDTWSLGCEDDYAGKRSKLKFTAAEDIEVPARSICVVRAKLKERHRGTLLIKDLSETGMLSQVENGEVLMPERNTERQSEQMSKGDTLACCCRKQNSSSWRPK